MARYARNNLPGQRGEGKKYSPQKYIYLFC